MSPLRSIAWERIEARQRGPAAPVVMLHGFLGAPAQWSQVVAGLGASPVALAVLPGHGPSPFFPGDRGFLDLADELACGAPAGEPSVLVGYSMGARLALAMALRHPARFSHLVLVGGSAGLGDAEREARIAWDDAQAERLLQDGVPVFVETWEALPLLATQLALPPALLDAQRAQRLSHTARGLAWAMRAMGLGRMPRLDVGRCAVPLTAVAGARDPKFTALAQAIAAQAPRGHALIVPGAGHNIALEAPAPLIAAIRGAAAVAGDRRRTDHV